MCAHTPGDVQLWDTEQSVVDQFEQQVAIHGDRLAIKTHSHALTYSELNSLANRTAHAIGSRTGPEPGRVALLFEPGAALFAAILGVLKSGQAYVPLDPYYPPVRNDFILNDAEPLAILTDGEHLALANQLAAGRHEVINTADLVVAPCEDNLGLNIAPDALGYIIYTSGSTGQPKGVLQTHRNLLHYIRSYTQKLQISPHDRLSLLLSPSFSASLMDIFGALLNGASLHSYNLRETGLTGLPDWLNGEAITVYHSVPTLLRHLVNILPAPGSLPSIRIVDLGGEPVYKRDVELFQHHFPPQCILVNHLACTEVSVIAQYSIDRNTTLSGSVVPVGHPAPGMEVLVVDEGGEPLPPGQLGELVIRSKYLSPGYWKRPELTQAAFQSGPPGSAERLYRTGDLGVIRPDGLVEHCGRLDHRVKVRGYTVEVAEIENALLALPGIKEAVATAQTDPHGDQRLTAYLVTETEFAPEIGYLRKILTERLPAYMVPAAFVTLPELPLTPSGKVDRAALPPVTEVQPEPETEFAEPRDALERQLQEFWQEALGITEIGIHDNFFALGGHSLLAAQVFARIEECLNIRLPLAVLFEAPTIAEMAQVLRRGDTRPRTASLVALNPAGDKPPLFFAHPASGDVFCYAPFLKYLGPEQPVYGFRAPGLNGGPMPGTIQELAAHYVTELRAAQPNGPWYLAGYSAGGVIAYEMAQQIVAQGEKVGLVAIVDLAAPRSGYRNPWQLLKPRFAYYFLRELPYGLIYFFAKTGKERRKTLGRVVPKLRRCLRLLFGAQTAEVKEASPVTDEETLDAHTPAWDQVNAAVRHAVKNYVPQPYPGRVILFRSRRQRTISSHDPNMGWDKLARGGFEVVVIPGDHVHLLYEPFLAVLAHKLRACLEAVQADESSESSNA